VDRISQLHELHDGYNLEDFDDKLMPITLLITRNRSKDGIYEYSGRKDWSPIVERLYKATITISDGCWPEGIVEDALLHEMIHQYQCEVLNVVPHHDKQFNDMCEVLEDKYGLDIK